MMNSTNDTPTVQVLHLSELEPDSAPTESEVNIENSNAALNPGNNGQDGNDRNIEKETDSAPPISNLISNPVSTPISMAVSAPASTSSSTSISANNPLHQIKTQLQVCVGVATMNVGELLTAQQHQVITLDSRIDQPVDILLEGKVIARGQLVAVAGCFAVRITELPLPLKA